jgi:hypothetical protein
MLLVAVENLSTELISVAEVSVSHKQGQQQFSDSLLI